MGAEWQVTSGEVTLRVIGRVMITESLWVDEITCSTVEEEEMRKAECWRTAVGQKSSGLARNYKEILKDKLGHVWKDREVWRNSQQCREFLDKWKSPLTCCVFLIQHLLTQCPPQGEDKAVCAFHVGQTPVLLMHFYWFSWLLCQLDFTLLSIA